VYNLNSFQPLLYEGIIMNTELAVNDNSGRTIAEMMGINVQPDGKKTSTLARLSIIHSAIMGEIEVAGKTIKTEVLPVGTYSLKTKDDEVVYCAAPTIRIFALRQQWTHWDSENNVMDRSIMANDLKGDLKDSRGGFNIGRPSGYVSDWDSVPQETKDIMRVVRRTKILFGTINLNGTALDQKGESIDGYEGDIPFILDIKNRFSINALDAVISLLTKKNVLPIQYSLTLGSEERSIPTGATFAIMTFTIKDPVIISDGDSEVLQGFLDWIDWSNNYVLTQWKDNNKQELSSDEDNLVSQLVDVEGVPV
tara:strand:+ start:87 stop:1013 length:927 start_codon:yes stop_codon:yes gene_type:complete